MAYDYRKKAAALKGVHAEGLQEVYREVTTFGEVLQPQPDTLDPANVLKATIEVTVSENPKIRVFQISFPETQMYGLRLINALAAARQRARRNNIFSGQGLFGIMADWEMPDKARKKEPNRPEEALARSHTKAFPNFWPDFVFGDRSDFMAAVTTPDIEDARNYFTLVRGRLMTETEARDLRASFEDKVRLGIYTVSGGKLVGLFGLNGRELSLKIRRQMAKSAYENEVSNKIIISPPYSDKVIKRQRVEYVDRKVSQAGGIVEVSYDKSHVKFDATGDTIREIERVEQDLTHHAIRPELAWLIDRKTGRRYYLDQGLPKGSLNSHKRAQRRLGFLLATSFSDQARDQLPAEMAYHSGGRKQPINEAQIPLLVYMEERMLLQGEVFKAVERRAGYDQTDQRRLQLDLERASLSLGLRARSMARKTVGNPKWYIFTGLAGAVIGFVDGAIIQTVQNQNLVNEVPIPAVSREELETAQQLNFPLLEYLNNNLNKGLRAVEIPAGLESKEALAKVVQYGKRQKLQEELKAELNKTAAFSLSWPLNRGTRDWALFMSGLMAMASGLVKIIRDDLSSLPK